MFPYFAVTGFVALMAVIAPMRRVNPVPWAFAFLVLLVFVGLRHHVGMDWNNYLIMIERVGRGTLSQAFDFAEPAFALILWTSGHLGLGVYGSNLVGTLVFCLGLFRYAKTTPYPWVALAVAMPMLVTVVAMSANRQAVAIGVLLWIVSEWNTSSLTKRVAYILVAALFHASALVFLVFAMADIRAHPVVRAGLVGLFLTASFFLMQWSGHADYYDNLYGSGRPGTYESPGALLHVLFNGGPALFYFLQKRRKQLMLLPNQLHRHMAALSIVLIPLAFAASTASSRISLYLFPVSMCIFSSIPAVASSTRERYLIKYLISLSMLGLLYLWLGFANSSRAHLPYGNLLTTPPELWRLCC